MQKNAVPSLKELAIRKLIREACKDGDNNKVYTDSDMPEDLLVAAKLSKDSRANITIFEKTIKKMESAEKKIERTIANFPTVFHGKPEVLYSQDKIDVNKTIATWLKSKVTLENLPAGQFAVLKWAISTGNVACCQLWFETAEANTKNIIIEKCQNNNSFITESINSGNFAMIKWIMSLCNVARVNEIQNQLFVLQTFIDVMKKCHNEFFIYLFDEAQPELKGQLLARGHDSLFDQSVAAGNLHICQFLLSKMAPELKLTLLLDDQYSALSTAAGAGHLAICEWIWLEAANTNLHCKLLTTLNAKEHNTLQCAIWKRHKAVCEWLVSVSANLDAHHSMQQSLTLDQCSTSFIEALSHGELEFAEWLLNQTQKIGLNICTDHVFNEVINYSWHLSSCKWFWGHLTADQQDQMVSLVIYDKKRICILMQAYSDILPWLWQVTTPEQKRVIIRNAGEKYLFDIVSSGSHFDTVKLIIPYLSNEQLNCRNANNETLLGHALHHSNCDREARFMIENLDTASLSLKFSDEQHTALHLELGLQLYRRNGEIAELLIDKMDAQALSIQKNSTLSTPLHIAISLATSTLRNEQATAEFKLRMTTIIKKLLTKLDSQTLVLSDHNGNTPLHCAIQAKLPEIAQLIIEKTSVSALKVPNKDSNIPLHIAIFAQDFVTAKSLVDRMDAEAFTLAGFYGFATALPLAIIRGQKAIAKLLIEKLDASALRDQKYRSQNALHLAIEDDENEIALLLCQKVDTELLAMQNDLGNTPLQCAIQKDQIELAKLLIQKMDSQPLSLSGFFGTALQMALMKNQVELVRMLVEKLTDHIFNLSSCAGNPFVTAVLHKQVKLAKKMEAKFGEAIARMPNKAGFIPLHIAIIQNDVTTAERLIENLDLATLEQQENLPHHPLMIASWVGNEELIHCLLQPMQTLLQCESLLTYYITYSLGQNDNRMKDLAEKLTSIISEIDKDTVNAIAIYKSVILLITLPPALTHSTIEDLQSMTIHSRPLHENIHELGELINGFCLSKQSSSLK